MMGQVPQEQLKIQLEGSGHYGAEYASCEWHRFQYTRIWFQQFQPYHKRETFIQRKHIGHKYCLATVWFLNTIQALTYLSLTTNLRSTSSFYRQRNGGLESCTQFHTEDSTRTNCIDPYIEHTVMVLGKHIYTHVHIKLRKNEEIHACVNICLFLNML